MRVVSWNIRRAATQPKQRAWTYLADLEPDVVLLQEVGDVPARFRDQYSVLHQLASGGQDGPSGSDRRCWSAKAQSPKSPSCRHCHGSTMS
jgi:exonuclease III